ISTVCSGSRGTVSGWTGKLLPRLLPPLQGGGSNGRAAATRDESTAGSPAMVRSVSEGERVRSESACVRESGQLWASAPCTWGGGVVSRGAAWTAVASE